MCAGGRLTVHPCGAFASRGDAMRAPVSTHPVVGGAAKLRVNSSPDRPTAILSALHKRLQHAYESMEIEQRAR
jgi:hypothetical protein